MKRIIITLFAAVLCLEAYCGDGHRLWLGDFLDWNPRQLTTYWTADSFDFAVDKALPLEGYSIKGKAVRGGSDIGLLYAKYELMRQKKAGTFHDVISEPYFKYRVLDHWDNLDGTIERGYAGRSIFWSTGLDKQQWLKRIEEYGRANASIGINGAVLNNVNANPRILTGEYLDSVRMIADVLRPYGVRVYLAVNFGSPKALGATATADPLDPSVSAWWAAKAKEIYDKIPDFGGFLVKANSEGQPGPFDYGRTHADGANMLAAALKPFGGIVMWRSFVYGAAHKGEDRVKQAVSEFKDLDGKFADNVVLQSKNGPLDFQPREPYAPIFDNMPKTSQWVEFQVTQEYTGQSKHLVYLAPMWKEFFSFVSPDRLKGVAGVSNVGNTANWCGHPFSQANWYAYGRLAWNPRLASREIAQEWLRMTFEESSNRYFFDSMTSVMERSREMCVSYMMPLGLHHIFKFDNHYGPEPGGFRADYPIEWCPVYYHKADTLGIGFDRTTSGSNAVSQYREPYRSQYNDLKTCPEQYLLWFHRVPWDYKMKNGKTLWANLCWHYERGVKMVETTLLSWKLMHTLFKDNNDEERWSQVESLLMEQLGNATEWKDTCLLYFQQFSRRPIGQASVETSGEIAKHQ